MIYPPLTETNGLYNEALNGEAPYVDDDGYPIGPIMTQLWLAGRITTEEFGREVLRYIEQDVDAGTVPWDVYDFTELHNFVDANEYALNVMGYDGSDAGADLANAVMDWVACQLRGDRPSSLEFSGQWHEERRFKHRHWKPAEWLAHVAAENRYEHGEPDDTYYDEDRAEIIDTRTGEPVEEE